MYFTCVLSCPLLLFPSNLPSIRVISSESVLCIRWPKYWSFSLSISPSSKFSRLIYLGLNVLITLQSNGLSSLFQHHKDYGKSSKASILRHSAFFMVQLSYPYMTSGKTIALTGWTFVTKVILCFKSYILCFISHICVQLLEKP